MPPIKSLGNLTCLDLGRDDVDRASGCSSATSRTWRISLRTYPALLIDVRDKQTTTA